MDKQNVVYPYDGILFGNTKKLNLDTFYNMGERWKHYVKWKKPVTEDHTLYGLLYEMSKIGKSVEIESGLVIARS